MVNLLVISNNPRCALLKNALLPQLKVIIDIVADFDHGLKDVFEKRPSVVCIQDHIDGVTGESVARHIQMLLGSSAPTFILLHEGNAKAKQIKGLFEQVVDVGQPDDKMADDVLSFLKATLGAQWDKVYIPLKQSRKAALAKIAVPDGERHVADKMVDEFLSDLEGAPAGGPIEAANGHVHDFSSQHADEDAPFQVTSSADEMAAMLAEVASQKAQAEREASTAESVAPPETTPAAINAQAALPAESAEPAPPKGRPARRKPAAKDNAEAPSAVATAVNPPAVPDAPLVAARAATEEAAAQVPTSAPLTVEQALAAEERLHRDAQQSASVPVADFRIAPQPVKQAQPADEHIPDDLLQAFEANYRSQKSSRTRATAALIVVLVALGAAGWYLLRPKPPQMAVVKKPASNPPVVPGTPATTPPAAAPPVTPAQAVQKQLSTPRVTASSGSVLPSFIPAAGVDKSFSARKPGWERYVDTHAEYRIFRTGERIKAIQVLDVKHQGLSQSLLKKVLGEVAGTPEYRESGLERKQGYQVVRGTIGSKAEVVLYRKNATLRAFVVSLN